MMELCFDPKTEALLLAQAQSCGVAVDAYLTSLIEDRVQNKANLRPAEYQRVLDLAAAADASEGIRQGLEELRQGKGRLLSEFREEIHA